MKVEANPCATEPDWPSPHPAPNFDRLSRIYRCMEWASFGPFLWWCRCAFLDEMSSRSHALVLGDGDGRFTARLLKTSPSIQIVAIDASASMLHALARRAGPDRARLRTIRADIRAWQPEASASYDLIVTHFFLDCLSTEEVGTLAERVRAWAAPNAVWVVSEFSIPDGWFGSLVARPIVSGLYRAFGWLTGLRQRRLPDHTMVLRAAGFGLVQRRTWLGGLLVGERWAVNSGLLPTC